MTRSVRIAIATFAALLAVLAPPIRAGAQPRATITMSASPSQVQVGQAFVVTVQANVVRARSVSMQQPSFDPGLDVIGSRAAQGGAIGAQVIVTQRYTVVARQPGTYRIRPAAVIADGTHRFESEPLTIEVGAHGSQPDPRPTSPPVGADGTVFDPGGFVRTVIDQAEPYAGQQVTVTIYLYARQPLSGQLTMTQEPTTEGFWVHNLLPVDRPADPPQRQEVRGLTFYVYVLRRFAAFPLRPGELTIGAPGVSVSSPRILGWTLGGPDFNRLGVPVTIQAKPLPADGRPQGQVHVGSLELSAELDRAQVATGDAVQLTVTARGTGQMQHVDVPGPSAEGLRVLQPEIDDQVGSPGDVVGGSRRFRWLLVPEREGTYSLGPFEVPVFDPISGTYSVARAPALRLTAAGNPVGTDAEPAQAEPSEATAERQGEPELGPIRTRASLSRSRSTLLEQPWIPWAFAGGPLLMAVALVVRAAQRRAANGGGPANAPKRARREARRRLSAAAKHAQANAPREFYAAVAQALKEVLEAKLARPVGSLTHPELRRMLVERGMAEGLAERVVDELEGCDFARFAAAGIRAEEMQSCLARAKGLLDELDRFTAAQPEEDA